MTTDFKTKCRGPQCGREVIMRVVDARPAHPYDPAEPCAACNGQGEIVVHTRDLFGEHTERHTCRKCKGARVKWTSHFGTCPDADLFRRPKEEA